MRLITSTFFVGMCIVLTACETPAPVVYKTLPADGDGAGSAGHKHSSGGAHFKNVDVAEHAPSSPPAHAVATNNAPHASTDVHSSGNPQNVKPPHAAATTTNPPVAKLAPAVAAVAPQGAPAPHENKANRDATLPQQQSADTPSQARSPALDIPKSNANGKAAQSLQINDTVGNITLSQQPTPETPRLTIPSGEPANRASSQAIHPTLADAQPLRDAVHSSSITLDRLAPTLASNTPSSANLALPVNNSTTNPPANAATFTLPLPPDAKAGAAGSSVVFHPTDANAILPPPQTRREAARFAFTHSGHACCAVDFRPCRADCAGT